MAKPKANQSDGKVVGVQSPLKSKSNHSGEGDSSGAGFSPKSKGTTSSSKLPTICKPKGKFTLPSTFATPRTAIPVKSQSIPNIPSIPTTSIRKAANPVRVSSKLIKPRKSMTMLEFRPNQSNVTESNYVKIFEGFGQDVVDFGDKYKYLAYKTYCFMMKNVWKRAKDERQCAVEQVAKLEKSVLKTKTQLHVIKSLYHIERQHFDSASIQLHEIKQKLVDVEKRNDDLLEELREKEVLVQNLDKSNEKLHQTLNDVTSKSNRMENQLDVHRDEISQLKNDKNFLINQRQEMEASLKEKLNRYKISLEHKNQALFESQQELERLEPLMEVLEMKNVEIDEYRYITQLQLDQIENLSSELDDLRESLKLKNRMKLVWNTLKKERYWYMKGIVGIFVPSLKSHDLLTF